MSVLPHIKRIHHHNGVRAWGIAEGGNEGLLENDKAVVTQTRIPPGAVSKADRKDRTNYIVKGADLQRTSADGKVTKVTRKTGEAVWLRADSDEVKNIGKTELVVVSIVNK